MGVSQSFQYKLRLIKTGELANAFSNIVTSLGEKPEKAKFTLYKQLQDGTNITQNINIVELETICEFGSVSYHNSYLSEKNIGVTFSNGWGNLVLMIEGESPKIVNQLCSTFTEAIPLDPPDPLKAEPSLGERVDAKIQKALKPIIHRLENLESLQSRQSDQMRCFLSYRFTDANEITALRIQQFFTLLKIDVITGSTYEPRQITKKILSRIKEPLDFIVLLVTNEGESMWTRDEIGAAVHKDIYLIPLIEDGAKFEPGLFGDIEYITYAKGHIGDVYLKLLQATHFLRNKMIESENI